jgi:hypothetical protein
VVCSGERHAALVEHRLMQGTSVVLIRCFFTMLVA